MSGWVKKLSALEPEMKSIIKRAAFLFSFLLLPFSFCLVAQTPQFVRSPNAATDFWIDRLLGRPMAPGDRDEIVRALAQADSPDAPLSDEIFAKRLPQLVELILMSPDFQWR